MVPGMKNYSKCNIATLVKSVVMQLKRGRKEGLADSEVEGWQPFRSFVERIQQTINGNVWYYVMHQWLDFLFPQSIKINASKLHHSVCRIRDDQAWWLSELHSMEMEEPTFEEILDTNRVEIVQRLQLDRTFLFDYLRSKHVLDREDCDLVYAEKTREQKAAKFLDVLVSKGEDGYHHFIDGVQLLNPSLYETITGEKATASKF